MLGSKKKQSHWTIFFLNLIFSIKIQYLSNLNFSPFFIADFLIFYSNALQLHSCSSDSNSNCSIKVPETKNFQGGNIYLTPTLKTWGCRYGILFFCKVENCGGQYVADKDAHDIIYEYTNIHVISVNEMKIP